jgi:hypothetical protein
VWAAFGGKLGGFLVLEGGEICRTIWMEIQRKIILRDTIIILDFRVGGEIYTLYITITQKPKKLFIPIIFLFFEFVSRFVARATIYKERHSEPKSEISTVWKGKF